MENAPSIAAPEEILATFTQLLRGEKSSEQLKAAEQLAKYYDLFKAKEEAPLSSEAVAEIITAVERIREEMATAGLIEASSGP